MVTSQHYSSLCFNITNSTTRDNVEYFGFSTSPKKQHPSYMINENILRYHQLVGHPFKEVYRFFFMRRRVSQSSNWFCMVVRGGGEVGGRVDFGEQDRRERDIHE